MKAAGGPGVIINNSSIHADNSCELFSLYATTKAALETMTKVMAVEFAEFGVRVNAVAPGVTLVERNAPGLRAAETGMVASYPRRPLRRGSRYCRCHGVLGKRCRALDHRDRVNGRRRPNGTRQLSFPLGDGTVTRLVLGDPVLIVSARQWKCRASHWPPTPHF